MALDFKYCYKHEHSGNACFIKETLSEAELLEILILFVIHFMVGKAEGEREKGKGKKRMEMEMENEGKNLARAHEHYTPSSTVSCCLFEWNIFLLERSLFSLPEEYFPGHCVIPSLHCFDPKQKRKILVKGFRVTS